MDDILNQAQAIAAQRQHINSERDAFLYQCALEAGNFGMMEIILERAQHDPALAQAIEEINAVEAMDNPACTPEEQQHLFNLVQRLLQEDT